ncbi:histidine phosphatase family protein [Planktotalea sp.]|uniref:histidine phosphatase family protein n=1 Tax=Planktotalea sp. TaxID=2029877 RepID=UPI003F6C1A92
MAFPKFYILRHGQTEWNVAARLQGQLDSPLTQAGQDQAQRQAEIMRPVLEQNPTLSMFTSPQGRARSTAKIVGDSLMYGFVTDVRLREIGAGPWDGSYLTDIKQSHSALFNQARNAFELMFLAPDGEGQHAVQRRCEAFLTEQTAPAILVTHGATLCVLRGILRGMSFDETLNLEHEQGCVYVIENGKETILR